MNILVTGANGQLGRSLQEVAETSRDHYLLTDLAELDILDEQAIGRWVEEQDIHLIINCAAYTQVDQAEQEPEVAQRLNVTAVGYLAEAMQRRNGWLIHISTDYVFDGKSRQPIREDHPASPLNIYGATKWGGEEVVRHSGCHHLILRTAWLYSPYGGNFVKTMLRLMATRPSVRVVDDQIGSPTYAYDLATAIFTLVEQRLYEGHEGSYHFTNEGACSWYDFACEIARYAGMEACQIHPCTSEEYASIAHRPAYSVLDKTLFNSTFHQTIPHWKDALHRCLDRMMQHENS